MTIALAVGVVITTFRNVWAANWTVIITRFGRAALIKGALLLALPDLTTKWTAWMPKGRGLTAVGAFALLVGLALCYYGYCPAAQARYVSRPP